MSVKLSSTIWWQSSETIVCEDRVTKSATACFDHRLVGWPLWQSFLPTQCVVCFSFCSVLPCTAWPVCINLRLFCAVQTDKSRGPRFLSPWWEYKANQPSGRFTWSLYFVCQCKPRPSFDISGHVYDGPADYFKEWCVQCYRTMKWRKDILKEHRESLECVTPAFRVFFFFKNVGVEWGQR